MYGQGRTTSENHHFLQGITHYGMMNIDEYGDGLTDACISDVYDVVPEIFDIKKLTDWYRKTGILQE